jgi:hypothetical protein
VSLVKVQGNASGTGIFTVAAPNSNTDRTLTLPDSTGTIATAESTLSQFNASGSAPVYACRAWVNFNGTGTVAIRASGNVSSITDNGTGDYTVNFTTAMPDTNYSFNGATQWASGNEGDIVLYNTATTLTTSAIRTIVGVPGTAGSTALTPSDRASIFVQIFR